MEPFDSQDPLTKLLAQARKIEARSNFTQNVLREARQTPQDRGWWAAVRAWWEESSHPAGRWAFAAGSVAALALTIGVLQTQPSGTSSSFAVVQPAPSSAASSAVETTTTPLAGPVLAEAETGMPDLPVAETAWEASYQTEALLAVDDTTQFTDSEIGFLLY